MPAPDALPARRSWGQRMLIAANAVALAAAAVTAGSLAYSNRQVSQIDRYELSDVTRADELADGDPQNYLVVGVDDASGLEADDSVRAGREDGSLQTDTIMVLRVDPANLSAQLLSFPRDLYVPIAGMDADQRLNVALATGGPERLIETIDEDFGIPIHHYIQVDFADFREIVDTVGGVPVSFPRPARSRLAGLNVEAAGCYTLGPAQALGFSRARKDYQVMDADGDWHTDPRSDFSRVERQQLFVELAMRQAIAKGIRNPNTLRRLVDAGVQAVRLDDALEVETIVDLGVRFRDFTPSDLETHTLQVTGDVVGGAQVLRLVEGVNEPILSIFRGVGADAAASLAPDDVTVQVLNGTGTQGQGSETTDALAALGFATVASADADELGLPTTVRYVAGGEGAAQLLARSVTGTVAYEQVDALDGADAVLVTGSDWVSVAPAVRDVEEVPAPPAGTPGAATTTAPDDDDPSSDPSSSDPSADDPSASTEAGDGAGATTEPAPTTTSTTVPVDSDDPSDPGFYLARAPGPDEECPRLD